MRDAVLYCRDMAEKLIERLYEAFPGLDEYAEMLFESVMGHKKEISEMEQEYLSSMEEAEKIPACGENTAVMTLTKTPETKPYKKTFDDIRKEFEKEAYRVILGTVEAPNENEITNGMYTKASKAKAIVDFITAWSRLEYSY